MHDNDKKLLELAEKVRLPLTHEWSGTMGRRYYSVNMNDPAVGDYLCAAANNNSVLVRRIEKLTEALAFCARFPGGQIVVADALEDDARAAGAMVLP